MKSLFLSGYIFISLLCLKIIFCFSLKKNTHTHTKQPSSVSVFLICLKITCSTSCYFGRIFFFNSGFQKFYCDVPSCGFLCIYTWDSPSFQFCVLQSFITFRKLAAIFSSNIVSVYLFLSFNYWHFTLLSDLVPIISYLAFHFMCVCVMGLVSFGFVIFNILLSLHTYLRHLFKTEIVGLFLCSKSHFSPFSSLQLF